MSDYKESILSHVLVFVLTVFGFYSLYYTNKHKQNLYNKSEQDEILGKKYNEEESFESLNKIMEEDTSFKFRNIWHFIPNIDDHYPKAFFYFYYTLRKIIQSLVLIYL